MEEQNAKVNINAISKAKMKIKKLKYFVYYIYIYINEFYKYLFQLQKGKLFAVLLNLQINSFIIDLPKMDSQIVNPRPKHDKDNQSQIQSTKQFTDVLFGI